MRVTIHQPEHMPWLGLLDKVQQVDLWVILDNVQYRRRYFQNRNKIRTASGWGWLTVPVHSVWGKSLINDITVDQDSDWQKRCWKTMRLNYARAPYFEQHVSFFDSLSSRGWKFLVDLNCEIIQYLLACFEIDVELKLASDMACSGRSHELILSLCKEAGASVYLSGVSGKDYLKMEDFQCEHIDVDFQEFYHPIYQQCYEPFIPYMSSVDLLFNYGIDVKRFLLGKDVDRLDYTLN